MVRIYLALKFHPDHRNRDLVDRISRLFGSVGVEVVCFARDFERWGERTYRTDELMGVALETIDTCSAVVVEFSEKGVGLGIEAGYATGRGIPVFVIHEEDAEVSATLQGIAREVLPYTDDNSLGDAIRRIVQTIDG